MSQVNSVKDLRHKQAKCLVQNRGQTHLIDIKSSFHPSLGLHIYLKVLLNK